MLKIVIDGKPIPNKRHVVTKRGHVYDPNKEERDKTFIEVQHLLRTTNNIDYFNYRPEEGPHRMEVIFFMPIPMHFSDKKRASLHLTYCWKRPDSSNLLKFYEDALNGLLWQDDSHISEHTVKRIYHYHPHTQITLKRLSTSEKLVIEE